MPVTAPVKTNYLYRVEYASNTVRWTNQAEPQPLDSEIYDIIAGGITHTPPRISPDAQAAELDLRIGENNILTTLFTLGPPPFRIKLLIYEYDPDTEIGTPHYRGWIIRPLLNLDESTASFHCKTAYHFYERESFTDSLSGLSRYSIFDERSGVDIESLRVSVTAENFNDLRDIVTVSGVVEAPPYYRGGVIVAPDRDMRNIVEHETAGADVLLTLSSAFNRFTLDEGFTADIYPGDDLLYETWANKFAAVTNDGEYFGGWNRMPNVDPAVRGVI